MNPQVRGSFGLVRRGVLYLALGLLAAGFCGCGLDLGDAPFKCNKGNPKCPDGYECKNDFCMREGVCLHKLDPSCPLPPDGGTTQPQPPRGKFCNGLQNKDGSSLTMLLKVGNANMFAVTGKCSACQNLPAGKQNLELWFKGEATAAATGSTTLKGGTEYIFLSNLDTNNAATVEGGPLKPEYKCATVDPFKTN